MNILNIHGFDGSSQNTAYTILTDAGHKVTSIQLDYRKYSPQQIYTQLMPLVALQKIDLIVATSFGAFFGNRLANEFGVPCIFLNPCLRPDISLREIAPEYFTEENEAQIQSWIADQTFYSYTNKTVIIGEEDEIIDHESITIHEAAGAKFYAVPGGKHQLTFKQIRALLKKEVKNYEKMDTCNNR